MRHIIKVKDCSSRTHIKAPSMASSWQISHAVLTLPDTEVTMAALNKLFLAGNEAMIKDMVNLRNECGQTLLIRAIFIESDTLRQHTLEALLKVGADVWVTDVYGRNALMWACLFRQDTEVSSLLKRAGSCDLLHADIHGNTALHLAVTSGSAASVKSIKNCMLDKGMEIDIENNYGITPGMEAKRLGHDVCYSLLMSGNNREGRTQPASRAESQESDNNSFVGSNNQETYRHFKRQPSSGASSVTSLPPLVSPEIKKRMDSLDLKACWSSFDEDPSSSIHQLCKESTTKSKDIQKKRSQRSTNVSIPPLKQSNDSLPQISVARKAYRNVTMSMPNRQVTMHQSCNESLPEINLTDSIVCVRR